MDLEVKRKVELDGIRNALLNTIPDGMTNGDVIKVLFPNIETFEPNKSEIAIKLDLGWLAFKKDWWYAPFVKGENNEFTK